MHRGRRVQLETVGVDHTRRGDTARAQLLRPMIEAPSTDGLYLLHFAPPYKHARHYLGYADDIAARVRTHRHVRPRKRRRSCAPRSARARA